jgi:ribonuclease Z
MNPELYILGSSSATPTRERHPSAQILKIEGEKILIDCGEGTQSQMIKYGIRHTGINTICISHLHGDHYFGLIGLISTMSLMGRTQSLTLIGPPGLKQILELQIEQGGMSLKFELIYIPTSMDKFEKIYETDAFEIKTFPLKHRIHCTGFVISEKKKERNLNIDSAKEYNIPISAYKEIKLGADYTNEKGEIINNDVLTFDPAEPKSFAYCSDTIFDPSIVEYIKDCNLLYHEATYMRNLEDRAELYFHSTAEQAAKIAKLANVGHLIIGHYSSRYDHLGPLLEEAKSVFPKTSLAIEGEKHNVKIYNN